MLKRTGSWTSFLNTDEQLSGSQVQQSGGQSPLDWEMSDDLPAGTARSPAAAQAIAQAKALSAKPVSALCFVPDIKQRCCTSVQDLGVAQAIAQANLLLGKRKWAVMLILDIVVQEQGAAQTMAQAEMLSAVSCNLQLTV